MPSIKKGYSLPHDRHPNWLYVPAFDCHVRITVVGKQLGWVADYINGTRYKKQRNWIGWFLSVNCKCEKGAKMRCDGEMRMYKGLEKNKKSNISLLDFSTLLPNHNFTHFKNRGVHFAVHWYNEATSLCIIGCEAPSDDSRKVYCFKNYGYYPLMKSNLYSLKKVFDKLEWSVEERFNWMQLALSDKAENVMIANSMLQACFDETNNRN